MDPAGQAEGAGQGGAPGAPARPRQSLGWVLEELIPLPQATYGRLRAKFDRFDRQRCGQLTDTDLQAAYSTATEEFPIVAARCLVRLFSSEGQVSFNQFLYLDRFSIVVLSVYRRRAAGPAIPLSELPTALSDLGVALSSSVCAGLTTSPLCKGPLVAQGYLSFVSFFAVCSFVVLALTRFQRWGRGSDTVALTAEKLVSALLWFI